MLLVCIQWPTFLKKRCVRRQDPRADSEVGLDPGFVRVARTDPDLGAVGQFGELAMSADAWAPSEMTPEKQQNRGQFKLALPP